MINLNIFAVFLWYLLTLFATGIVDTTALFISHMAFLFTLRLAHFLVSCVTFWLLQSLTSLVIDNLDRVFIILLTGLNKVINGFSLVWNKHSSALNASALNVKRTLKFLDSPKGSRVPKSALKSLERGSQGLVTE